MRVLVFSSGLGWNEAIMGNCRKGLEKRGHTVGSRFHGAYSSHEWEKCDAAVLMGLDPIITQIFKDYRDQNVPVLLITDGFLNRKGDRMERHWAVGKNGFHAYAEQPPFHVPGDRWAELGIELQPWKKKGKNIVIAHQFSHLPIMGTAKMDAFPPAIQIIQQVSNRPIVFRTHPLESHSKRPDTPIPAGCIRSEKATLAEDLEDAWALVTYDSNAAVEALIAGVPIFTLGRCLTDACTNSDLQKIEDPLRPDRQQLFNWIAYTQWTPEEMLDGLPFLYYLEPGRWPVLEALATEKDPKAKPHVLKTLVDQLEKATTIDVPPVFGSEKQAPEEPPEPEPEEPEKTAVEKDNELRHEAPFNRGIPPKPEPEEPIRDDVTGQVYIELSTGERLSKADLREKLRGMTKNQLWEFGQREDLKADKRLKKATLIRDFIGRLFPR